MNSEVGVGQVTYVNYDETTVCCRGVNKALGHPAVYLSFSENTDTVQCYYCGCEFKQKQQKTDDLSVAN